MGDERHDLRLHTDLKSPHTQIDRHIDRRKDRQEDSQTDKEAEGRRKKGKS